MIPNVVEDPHFVGSIAINCEKLIFGTEKLTKNKALPKRKVICTKYAHQKVDY